MYTTVLSFEHLRQAEDERMRRELEYRRIARERAAESKPATTRAAHRFLPHFHRPAHAGRTVLSPTR